MELPAHRTQHEGVVGARAAFSRSCEPDLVDRFTNWSPAVLIIAVQLLKKDGMHIVRTHQLVSEQEPPAMRRSAVGGGAARREAGHG